MAYRSSASQAGSATTHTNRVITIPGGGSAPQAGDIAVFGLYKENTAAVTPESGFTQKAALTTQGSSRGTLYVYWKRLTGADTGTYTFSWTGGAWAGAVCAWFSGRIGTGDPFDGTVGTAESTSGVTTLNVSTSPVNANGDAVGFWTNFSTAAAWTPPSLYTERQETPEITLDTRDTVASGSTGNVTATSSVSDFMKAFVGVLQEATASGVTGTITETQDANTSAASGVLEYSGSSAVTQADQTSSASGVLGYSGTITRIQADQTATASGTSTASGTAGSIAVTQANQTSTASGVLGYSGSSARTQANQTSTASGTITAPGTSGTVAATQASQVSTGSGVLGYSGTSARTQAANVAAVSGTVANPVTGTAAIVQAAQFATATGAFQALIVFGTSGAGIGLVPASHPNLGLAPFSTSAASTAASASGATSGVPSSTGA